MQILYTNSIVYNQLIVLPSEGNIHIIYVKRYGFGTILKDSQANIWFTAYRKEWIYKASEIVYYDTRIGYVVLM